MKLRNSFEFKFERIGFETYNVPHTTHTQLQLATYNKYGYAWGEWKFYTTFSE